MKKCIYVILVALCLINLDASAQNQKGVLSKIKSKRTQIHNADSIGYILDSLNKIIMYKDSIANDYLMVIATLKESINSDSVMINDILHDNDSLANVIISKDKEIKRLETELGNEKNYVDTCVVKLANRWLFQRFRKRNVDEVISYFERINSSKLRDDYLIVHTLLKEYEKSYMEFQSILREAQNDEDREIGLTKTVGDFKARYKQRIESMPYYKKYYKKDWTIKYLDEQIDKVLEMLNNHTKDKPVDFEPLIDKEIK